MRRRRKINIPKHFKLTAMIKLDIYEATDLILHTTYVDRGWQCACCFKEYTYERDNSVLYKVVNTFKNDELVEQDKKPYAILVK
jgi:hypothetical protein